MGYTFGEIFAGFETVGKAFETSGHGLSRDGKELKKSRQGFDRRKIWHWKQMFEDMWEMLLKQIDSRQ